MSNWRLDETETRAMIDLLSALVRMASPDPPGDETEIAGFLADHLRTLGFDVTTDEFAPGRINVIARLNGGGGPALVFSAHMDTMPIGEADWTHPPFGGEVHDGRLYGRGAADMKGGLSAMVAAATKVMKAGQALSGDLVLAFSAGESAGCIGAKRMVETDALADAGWLLVSEPSSLDILIAETGALWLEVSAHGKTGHASAGQAETAIQRLLAFLDRLDAESLSPRRHPLLGKLSVAVNGLSANSAPNIAPDRASAILDIRTLPGDDSQTIIDAVLELAGPEFSVQVIDDKPPVETTSDDPFVTTCSAAVTAVRGSAQAPAGVHYFSDSNVLVPALNIPRVIIGPGEAGMSGSHNEWVALEALEDAAAIYGEIAERTLIG